LAVDDLALISRWATDGLVPDVTVLLDVPAETGLGRAGDQPDRLEAEPAEFHDRVRAGFRQLAERDPSRYLVVDATLPVDVVAALVRERIDKLFPEATNTAVLPALPVDPEPVTAPIQVGEG
jgi:dTMP kinase